MTIDKDDFTVEFDHENNTNIAFGTAAEHAYEAYLAKMRQIYELKFECELLVDKYHAEMKKAPIPVHLRKGFLNDLFDNNKKRSGFARKVFLEQSFSEKFLKKHKPKFSSLSWFGYRRTAAHLELDIGDYLYTIEIPIPENIVSEDDMKNRMGEVKFRVDRLHKSKDEEFVRKLEPVQMPTYDRKKCFEAIEAIVGKEEV